MGLKIVKCNQIVPLGINRVQVGSRYVDIYSCNFTVEISEIGNNVLFALSYCHWSRLLDMCSFSGCSGHWYGIRLGFGQKCPEKLLTCIFLPSLLLSDVSTLLQDSLWHNVQVNIDADNIDILLYLFQCHFCRSIVVENNFRFNRNVRLHWHDVYDVIQCDMRLKS